MKGSKAVITDRVSTYVPEHVRERLAPLDRTDLLELVYQMAIESRRNDGFTIDCIEDVHQRLADSGVGHELKL